MTDSPVSTPRQPALSAGPHWKIHDQILDLSESGIIMGVLNVTPDSFSDGGCFFHSEDAIRRGKEMADEGATILDIGGESTRPGSEPVPAEVELERVLPVIRALRKLDGVLLSIDTSKALVARRALEAGADIVNDVTALRGDPDMLAVVAGSTCGVVLMHMRGTPGTMQDNPTYGDVTEEVLGFLNDRVEEAEAHGVARKRICIDPGFGFGKTFEHNRTLLRNLPKFVRQGLPVLVGLSRKSFLGQASGTTNPNDRLWPGVAITSHARKLGARIFRVHDPRENLHALRMTEAILRNA